MKKVDSGEFHNLNQYNDFSEYQPFSAEQYYSTEAQKPPVETQQYDESYENEGGKSVNSEGAESSTDFNDIQKQYDNVNQPDSSGAADSSAPTNANVNATQTASTSSSSAAQAGSVSGSAGGASTAAASASTAAAGASVGATAVAAVVIVSAAVTGGLIANFDSYVGNNLGADYVSITVDMDEILSQSNKTYSLSADNFAIEFTGGETPVNIGLVNGKHSYLITGLQPEKTYSYTITCNSASFGSNSTCYSQTVTTKSVGKGECVYDELNNYVVYDEVTQTASVFYSIYLSDYEKEYANSTFYICSSEQTDLNNINHIIYSDDTLDENNFFKGELNGVIYDELYLYVVAENQTEQGADKAELFTLQLSVNLPEEWKTAKSPAFVVDESAESVTSLPDSIYVGGSLNKLNENYTYYAYVTQYDSDGTTLVERQEVGLTVDPANMSYSLNVGAYYGVNKFKYVIYTKDDSGNEITVYESADKSFTASQAFGASYNVIEPINAKYEYTAEKLTITVDPAFTSDSDIYSYKLVLDCNDKVYGEYQGTGVAVFEITDFSDLDYIEFTYTDIGEFADGEHVYEMHSPTFIEFGSIFLDLGTTSITMGDGRIWVGGVIDSLNENFTYSAYVAQYALDGTPLCERKEVELNINAESMSFWFECATYYEVKKFKYVIYTHDNNGDEVIVYDDGEREFTASQEYGATYTIVEPADATIEYTAEKITITVDPAFTSEHSIYSYKLVVTNSTGQVYGEYQGTGVASIEITDFAGLDTINFTYYDLGQFADGEHEFAQNTTTGIAFNNIFIDVGVASFANQPDSITVNGKLNKLNENFTYSAYVAQYAQDGTALVEREEVTLNIDAANMSYSLECGAYYGVKTFKYVIYTNDGTNEITVYESADKAFTASQEYSATYNKVTPAAATIEYTAEKITITVDPEFDSTYSIYSYKLVVTNSAGTVFGEYQGTGVAVFEITDFTGLDTINFTYYDLGQFADGEHEFAQNTTAGIAFNNIFIDVGVTSFANQPDSITVNGKLNKLNENFTYSAYVAQYAQDGTALVEREEVTLNIDTANMSYSFECGAYYGVNTYKYVIYTNDGTNEIAVYESAEETFTASQEYSATYTKVAPAAATIEYTAEKITITVDPEFDSTYSIYSYKLVVTNSSGQAYGEYQGMGVASIEITDFTGLDTINFTYYDLGEFADGEHEFAEHTTAGVAFNNIFIDVGVTSFANQPDGITVSGKLNKLNENFTYSAYVAQYAEDGTALVEREEVTLNIDTANMSYSFECGAYYGVNTYKYVIYTNDGTNEIAVYESGENEYTASQEYGATYTKVEPADATIEYTAEKITITVDPEFDSTYSIYSYKLVVTNSTGQVYGEYQGTGVAVFEISDFAGLDTINFTYYDIGEFADGEREFAEHATEGVAFCMPTLSLGADYGFNGQYFTLSYTCDMDYDYANASIDISVTNADGVEVYTKNVGSVAQSGTIILDNYEGEFGSVTVTATLNFKDNQSDGAIHSLELAQANYAMNFSFEVTKVVADVSAYIRETMSVKLNFDHTLPDGYMVKITDDANAIDLTLPLAEMAEGYSINDLDMSVAYNLTIQATDAGGNAWGEAKTINISKSAAEAEYTSPIMNCPNPGDALVTYNDDGTINIYREMILDAFGRDTISDDERVYYNAFIYAGYYIDSEGNAVYTKGYDVIGRGKYAVIENIPKENYMFVYYQMFDFNGVSYVMYTEIPSGTIDTVYKDEDGFADFATAAVSVSGGQTIITVNVSAYGAIGNKITVNGVEYEYDSYSDDSATDLTLTIDGEIDVTEVKVFFTMQGYNYDAYSEKITIKGSKYGKHQIKVTTAEA